jgi:hypothetical protein
MTIAEKLTKIAENMQNVYDAGYDTGHKEGKKAECEAFWDVFQDNGNRTTYKYAFSENWNDDIFKPKYDIKPTDASVMFINSQIVDLKGCLERQGVVLDTSNCTTILQIFQGAKTKYIPTLDLRKCTSMSYAFNTASIETIEKLIVSETTPLGTSFQYCSGLTTIVIEGIIGVNVSFGNCSKLTVDSLKSILSALKDISGTGTSLTCTLGATNRNKLSTAEKAVATQKGWTLA